MSAWPFAKTALVLVLKNGHGVEGAGTHGGVRQRIRGPVRVHGEQVWPAEVHAAQHQRRAYVALVPVATACSCVTVTTAMQLGKILPHSTPMQLMRATVAKQLSMTLDQVPTTAPVFPCNSAGLSNITRQCHACTPQHSAPPSNVSCGAVKGRPTGCRRGGHKTRPICTHLNKWDLSSVIAVMIRDCRPVAYRCSSS